MPFHVNLQLIYVLWQAYHNSGECLPIDGTTRPDALHSINQQTLPRDAGINHPGMDSN